MARVLIVDDEPDALFLFRLILEGAGHEVLEAAHGVEALALLADSQVDLVFTDLMMPVMDGRQLIERLRADPRTARIPIVMASANPSATAAADATLRKPVPPQRILDVIERLIGVR